MVQSMMTRLKIPEDQPIEAKMVSKAIERAQRQVEAQHFESRKNVLKYDDVINTQREIIYKERNRVLDGENLREQTLGFITEIVEAVVDQYATHELPPEEWDLDGFFTSLREIYPTSLSKDSFEIPSLRPEDLEEAFKEDAVKVYEQREAEIGFDELREIERRVLLSIIDTRWREHLYEMDYLQEGIGLRAVEQKDPLVEYQREGYEMFANMNAAIKEDFVRYVFHLQVIREQQSSTAAAAASGRLRLTHGDEPQSAVQESARSDKVGRNAPWARSTRSATAPPWPALSSRPLALPPRSRAPICREPRIARATPLCIRRRARRRSC
jgi:preprotein translocase subunit SecA